MGIGQIVARRLLEGKGKLGIIIKSTILHQFLFRYGLMIGDKREARMTCILVLRETVCEYHFIKLITFLIIAACEGKVTGV